jgi:RNA recognition motif-containing protein
VLRHSSLLQFRRVKSPQGKPDTHRFILEWSRLLGLRGVKYIDGSAQKEHAMSTNLYVGNLTFNTSSAELEALFAQHGPVSKAQVVTDRDTGRSRGFGFVEMESADDAQKAISSLDGKDLDGRQLTVNLAKERSR